MGKMKVIIVDDEMELVETLVERLTLRGMAARGVSNGPEAIRLVREEPFDIVLLDVKMPGMNGLQVLEAIKAELPEQKVILFTGHGSRHDAEEGFRLGAYDYLMKPLRFEKLVSILQDAAGMRDE